MIIHGVGGGASGWLKTLPELCRHFTVFAPDLPGFGLSESLSGKYGIDDFVGFVDKFAASLGLKSFYLVGHSMGGAIATRYALRYKEKVNKLVIVDGVGVGKDMAPWLLLTTISGFCHPVGALLVNVLKAVKWTANRLFNSVQSLNPPLPLATVFLGASMALFAKEADSLVLELAALAIPMLVVWGAKDKLLPVSNAYYVSRLHPACKIHIFKNGGHSAYSKEAGKFAAVLADFLG